MTLRHAAAIALASVLALAVVGAVRVFLANNSTMEQPLEALQQLPQVNTPPELLDALAADHLKVDPELTAEFQTAANHAAAATGNPPFALLATQDSDVLIWRIYGFNYRQSQEGAVIEMARDFVRDHDIGTVVVHVLVSLKPVTYGVWTLFNAIQMPVGLGGPFVKFPWVKFYEPGDTGWSTKPYLIVNLDASPRSSDTIEHPGGATAAIHGWPQ